MARLQPALASMREEMRGLRAEEQALTQPDQRQIRDWQAQYNQLLRSHLAALAPSLVTLDPLLRLTEQARQQRITLRGSHAGHGAVAVWITQIRQFLKEEERYL